MIGKTIGGCYRVLELVGGGAFADVYLARDVRSNIVVALKVLHPHLARDPELVQRFTREAEMALALNEAHVVRVLDVGDDGDIHYIVMEYVQGRTLDQLIRSRGPLPIDEAVGLACQALEALEAAHASGIVHRDIKPQNLMLMPDGLLKVMDFGIARHSAQGSFTQTGIFLGTPKYMSPEQACGNPIDGRSDLYSLAVTLFELLTGRPPFEADTSLKTLQLHVHVPPPRLTEFRPDAPPALEQVLLRAMQKSPADRFRSAREMQEALRAALLDRGDSAAPPAPRIEAAARSGRAASSAALALVEVLRQPSSGQPEPELLDPPESSAKELHTPPHDHAGSRDVRELLRRKGRFPPRDWTVWRRRLAVTGGVLGLLAIGTIAQPWEWVRSKPVPDVSLPPLPDPGLPSRPVAAAVSSPPVQVPGPLLISGLPALRADNLHQIRPLGLFQQWVASPATALSPDGRWLAFSYGSRGIRVWDLEAGREAWAASAHGGPVRALSFSPDGQVLASASNDRTVKLWQADSGRELRTLAGHKDWVRAVTFSPDGSVVATASDDRTVWLWDAGSGRHLRTLAGHSALVSSVSFSPDGSTIATASVDGTVRLWRADGREVRVLDHNSQVWSVAFSPDGRLLATGMVDNSVSLWNAGAGEWTKTLTGHGGQVWALMFLSSGELLASASADHTVKLWEAQTGREVRSLDHSAEVVALSSARGSLVAAASADGAVKLWGIAALP